MSSANTSRRVAFETIRAVNESDAYANLLLPKAIARAGLDTADAGLATELTYGTLRRQGTYDAVIQIAADRRVQEIDPAVLDALRLGAHQLLSTRVASHAAVNESVELARSAGSRGAAGLRERGAAAHLARHAGGVDGAGRGGRALGRRAARPGVLAPGVDRARLPARAGRRGPRRRARGAADGRQRVAARDDGRAARTRRRSRRRAAHAVLAVRLPPRRRRPRRHRARVGRSGARAGRGLAARRARADPRRCRCSPASAGSTCAPVRAARPPCSPPRRCSTAPASRRTRSRPRAPGSSGRRSRASRSRSRSRRRTAASAQAPTATTGSSSTRRARAWARCAAVPKRAGASRRPTCPSSPSCRASCSTAAIGGLRPGGVVAYVTCSPHLGETAGVVADVRREFGDAIEELDARAVLRGLSGCRPGPAAAERRLGPRAAVAAPPQHRRDVDHAAAAALTPESPPARASLEQTEPRGEGVHLGAEHHDRGGVRARELARHRP